MVSTGQALPQACMLGMACGARPCSPAKYHFVLSILKQMKEGETGDKYAKSGYFSLIRVPRSKPCPTITQRQGNKGAGLCHWTEDRELTVKELTRLMSFPYDYYLGNKYTDKTERLGRAVPPLLMKEVASHIYETILKKIKTKT
jgi:DNA (cytosine-5)-methyltransferase 1